MSFLKDFSVIAAITKDNGIGNENRLPWSARLHIDMSFFLLVTKLLWRLDGGNFILESKESQVCKNAVIMGRKTWQSVRNMGLVPFRGRVNVVLSKVGLEEEVEGLHVYQNLDNALEFLSNKNNNIHHILVIGGSQIYKTALGHKNCRNVFLTRLIEHDHLPVDTYFPPLDTTEFRFSKNITLDVLTALDKFEDLKKSTKELICENITLNKNGCVGKHDAFVCEGNFKYLMMLYMRPESLVQM